jgi:hypothetical protein
MKTNPPPNYIPVKNIQDFNYDVYSYYNQYCASPRVTQNRRVMRNYLSNQNEVKKFNQNPFLNNKNKTFNFLYTNEQTYMFVKENNILSTYILINNNNWCLQRRNTLN